jgi:hypothetical protein
MRKILFMKLFILICTFAFSQNAVTVLEDENQESTIVTFVTTDGSFVPIRRDAGRIEFEETTSRIVIEQFEHILDAPGKIELEPGRYEFTLYDGGYDFVINMLPRLLDQLTANLGEIQKPTLNLILKLRWIEPICFSEMV